MIGLETLATESIFIAYLNFQKLSSVHRTQYVEGYKFSMMYFGKLEKVTCYNAFVLRSSMISLKSGALIVRYSQKKERISFVFYCSENLSVAITSEPLVRFR